ncbi:hypothetical protein OAK19_04865 [Aureispira]|nr:hypothetical protein [Aureispira sp.]
MSKTIKKIVNLFHNAFWLALLLFIVFMQVISEDIENDNKDNEDLYVEVEKDKYDLDTIFNSLKPKEEFKRNEDCETINKVYSWKNLSWSFYKIKFSLCTDHILSARDNRNNSNAYGEVLYNQLYSNDSVYLSPVIETFTALKEEKKLNKIQLLEAIVTFIQDIPYTYILGPGRTCGSSFSNSKGELMHYPKYNCKPMIPSGCCDNVNPWGIYSPLEFLSNETGDCDTRSLLAFAILRKFGYDVAVVNSILMGHSMLGVHVPYVPGNGSYGLTTISRKKYYLWELTAKGWHLGDNYNFPSNDWWVIYQ